SKSRELKGVTMPRRIMLRFAPVLIMAALSSVFAFSLAQADAVKDPTTPPAIRITPRAPVFDNARRLEELASRRKRVAEAIGSKAALIMFSAEPRVYANDVDYQYRQENNLY